MRAASKPEASERTLAKEVEILWCTHEHGLGIVHNVLVFRDEVTPSPAAVYALRDNILKLAERYPDEGVVLFYVSPDVDAEYPDEPTRAAFLDLLRGTRPVLRGIVYSVLRGGLMGVTVRALARAILHAARVGDSSTVATTLDEAGAWCEQRSLATSDDILALWHRLGVPVLEPSGQRPAEPPARSSRPPKA